MPMFPSFAGDPKQKRTLWENIVVSTPVVMTVVATVLAGLSSSEMSSSQYFRSLAAQMQSKVSDQWSFFQAKRFRELQCRNTLQVLEGVTQLETFDGQDLLAMATQLVDRMSQTAVTTNSADSQNARDQLSRARSLLEGFAQAATRPAEAIVMRYTHVVAGPHEPELPTVPTGQPLADEQIAAASRAVGDGTPESTAEQLAGQIDQARLDSALAVATKNAADFDVVVDPISRAADQIDQIVRNITLSAGVFERAARQSTPGSANASDQSQTAMGQQIRQLNIGWMATRLRFDAGRYERDAQNNQVLAQVYEIRVRKDGFISERHRQRSKEFFYGMLGAQAGVTIATLSLAVQRRSLLWAIAAAAGLAAVSFAAYVYLFV
jgi:hypothetical protein